VLPNVGAHLGAPSVVATSAVDGVHPQTAQLLAMLAAQPRVDPRTIAIEDVRSGYHKMLGAMFDGGLVEDDMAAIRCERCTVPSPEGGVQVRVYTPRQTGSHQTALPVLQYMHGGGWTQGNAAGYDAFTRALCAHGSFAVVSVDYRLAPEHPSPAAADDCFAVLRWLAAGADGASLAPDVGRLALSGDSAGGHLTIVTALAARDAGIALRSVPAPCKVRRKCAVCILQ
jgi:acetyl esterase/lipase